MSELLLRPMDPENDRHYILGTWLGDFRRSKWAKVVGGAYYPGHSKLVQRLLEESSVMVCCWPESPDYILGWACTGPGAIVHYVYVRKDWRGQGIAKRLLSPFLGKPCRVTHAVSDKRFPAGFVLDPYPLMKG